MKRPTIGIALGGGGARGMAHLGVLRALENAGFIPDAMSGTSMGAVVAVCYLHNPDFISMDKQLRQFVLLLAGQFQGLDFMETEHQSDQSLLRSALHSMANKVRLASVFTRTSVNDGHILREIVEEFMPRGNLEGLCRPVYVCALDSVSGQGILINRGDIREAVRAALSVSGYFPGQVRGGRLLHDAQAIFPVPVQAFQFEPVDLIIAVDVGLPITDGFKAKNAVDLLFRQSDISYHHIAGEIHNCADLVIVPEVADVHWTQFRKMDQLIQKGFEAGERAIPRIRELIKDKKNLKPSAGRPWHRGGYSGGREGVVVEGWTGDALANIP
jgi:NTE family protein